MLRVKYLENNTFVADNDIYGAKYYKQNHRLHRENGPAFINSFEGVYIWNIRGVRHRVDGPAVITSASNSWFFNGKLHREDGPAIEWSYGFKEYYLHGQYYGTKRSFNEAKKSLKDVKC